MKRNILILMLLGIFINTFGQAMEYPEQEGKKEVKEVTVPGAEVGQEGLTLVSSNGQQFVLTKQAALQSPLLATLLQMSGSDSKHQTSLSSQILSLVIDFLTLQTKVTEPYTQNLLHFINKLVVQAELSKQEKKELAAAADMYELKLFPAYIANRLAEKYQKKADFVEKAVKVYENQPQLQEKIAHYLFLLHGIKLPINYSLSVQDLIDYNRLAPIDNYLDLSSLHIADLSGLNTIAEQENVEVILLNDNQIAHINVDAFKGFNNLKVIDLSNNEIEFIDQKTFHNLSNLENIYLSGNRISQLAPGIFDDLNKVRTLNLSNNQLEYIDPVTFQKLIRLQNLSLANNKLKQLAPETFKGLSDIETIDLSDNKIEQLKNTLFKKLPYLGLLNLSGNPIPPEDRFEIERVTILWE